MKVISAIINYIFIGLNVFLKIMYAFLTLGQKVRRYKRNNEWKTQWIMKDLEAIGFQEINRIDKIYSIGDTTYSDKWFHILTYDILPNHKYYLLNFVGLNRTELVLESDGEYFDTLNGVDLVIFYIADIPYLFLQKKSNFDKNLTYEVPAFIQPLPDFSKWMITDIYLVFTSSPEN